MPKHVNEDRIKKVTDNETDVDPLSAGSLILLRNLSGCHKSALKIIDFSDKS